MCALSNVGMNLTLSGQQLFKASFMLHWALYIGDDVLYSDETKDWADPLLTFQ